MWSLGFSCLAGWLCLSFLFYAGGQPVASIVMVSGVQQSASAAQIILLPQTPLPSRIPLIEQSSLRCAVGPCWLSILNTATCTDVLNF